MVLFVFCLLCDIIVLRDWYKVVSIFGFSTFQTTVSEEFIARRIFHKFFSYKKFTGINFYNIFIFTMYIYFYNI